LVVAEGGEFGKRTLQGRRVAWRLDVFHAPVRVKLLRIQRTGRKGDAVWIVKARAGAISELI
jgi:hypothetical protein